MSVKMRQIVEKEICTAVVDALLKADCRISVSNGDSESGVFSSKATILKHMFLTDEDRLYVYRKGQTDAFGFVYFVYGNDGYDVMSDYTTNLEKYIGAGSAVDKVIEKYAD